MIREIKEIEKAIQSIGVKIDDIAQGGKHIKIKLNYLGNKKTFIKANTASDHRSNLNFMGDIKRWMKSVNNIK